MTRAGGTNDSDICHPERSEDLGGRGRDPSASPRNDTSDCCVHTVPVDVASDHDVQRARAERRGAEDMDVLVCSAGITGPNTTTWEYPVDARQQVVAARSPTERRTSYIDHQHDSLPRSRGRGHSLRVTSPSRRAVRFRRASLRTGGGSANASAPRR